MSKSRLFSVNWCTVALFMLAMPALNGCNGVNVLQGIRLGAGETPALGQRRFVLEGKGSCQSVDVDWGDGTTELGVVPVPGQRIELETSNLETRYLFHTFAGWGGGKTVTAKGVGCEGKVQLRFEAAPRTLKLGWKARAPSG